MTKRQHSRAHPGVHLSWTGCTVLFGGIVRKPRVHTVAAYRNRCPRRKEGCSREWEFFNNFNKWYKLCICRGLLRLRLAARCVRLRHETVSLASAHAYLCISLPPPCVCKSLRLAPHVEGKRVNASAARAYMRTAAVSLFGCRIGVSSVHTTSGIASLCVPDGIN